MRLQGAEVVEHGSDGLEAELLARSEAARLGRRYISPYNDQAVVAGQGTVGYEMSEQTQDLDAVVVAVGGGGLASGVAVALRQRWPHIRVVGAVPANSPVMAASVEAGRVLEMQSLPTLSDATAGGIEADTITFPLCQSLVDSWVYVTEEEIALGMRHLLFRERLVGEGAAGVAVAALLRAGHEKGIGRVAVVVCGGNVAAEVLRRVI
jgi:threonine dehydratase